MLTICVYFLHFSPFSVVDQNEIEALYDQYQALCTKRQGITREVYDRCLGPLGLEKNLVLDRLFKVG